MKTTEQSRFDTRLPKEQKELFEYAATLGGFRTLTEFVLFSVQQQASSIIEKRNSILASKKDQEIFFKSITKPLQPNNALKKAASRYNKMTSSK